MSTQKTADATDRLVGLLHSAFNFTKLHEDSKHKSEICRAAFHHTKPCRFGTQCDFAHTITELSPRVFDHINFKKATCSKWNGGCPYGTRCLYLHDEKLYQLSERMTILHSASENKFRIIRDQGNGTVCAFTLDTDCTPRDDLGGKILKCLWLFVDGDFEKLFTTAVLSKNHHRTPIKTAKKVRRKNKGAARRSPKNKKRKGTRVSSLPKRASPKRKMECTVIKTVVDQNPPPIKVEVEPEKTPVPPNTANTTFTIDSTQLPPQFVEPSVFADQSAYNATHMSNPYLMTQAQPFPQYSPPPQMFPAPYSPQSFGSQPYMMPPPIQQHPMQPPPIQQHHVQSHPIQQQHVQTTPIQQHPVQSQMQHSYLPTMQQTQQSYVPTMQQTQHSYVPTMNFYTPAVGVTMPPSPPESPKRCQEKDVDQKEGSVCGSTASEKSPDCLKSSLYEADLSKVQKEEDLKRIITQLRQCFGDREVAMAKLTQENVMLRAEHTKLSSKQVPVKTPKSAVRVCSMSPPPNQQFSSWQGPFQQAQVFYGDKPQTNPFMPVNTEVINTVAVPGATRTVQTVQVQAGPDQQQPAQQCQ